MTVQDKLDFIVIGAMAGSSMDGLDLAKVHFTYHDKWSYEILSAHTYPYPSRIYDALSGFETLTHREKEALDVAFGIWVAQKINAFDSLEDVELIALHGHTAVHDPKNKLSWQLGKGEVVAKNLHIKTITEFRNADIEQGGEGAPLVPVGDFLLFSNYEACLNLGGIANVSIREKKTAADICPCNQVLNYYAQRLDKPYDGEGKMAREGDLCSSFLNKLNSIAYFDQAFPKSLPNHFLSQSLLNEVPPVDGLHSYTRFIAAQIKRCVASYHIKGEILVSGGGAFNTFLVECIQQEITPTKLILPSKKVILYKEALIFAFLGLKRMRGEINVLKSVTGSKQDSCAGTLHFP